MKTKFFKGFMSYLPAMLAITVFILFSGLRQPEYKPSPDVAATQCCTGYNIPANQLKQFMLDSLSGIQFEGGIYSKASLLTTINAIPGTSIYLLNVLKNCSISQGTDLVLTSPTASGVAYVRALCRPCPNPNKPCCSQTVCTPRINWSCINFTSFPQPGAISEQPGTTSSEQ